MAFYAVYNIISKSYSDIGTKIILKLNSFCLQNNVIMLINSEDACNGALIRVLIGFPESTKFIPNASYCHSMATAV